MGRTSCGIRLRDTVSQRKYESSRWAFTATRRRAAGTNPDAGTGGLEHLVPQRVAMAATLSETAYDEPKESLRELLLNLQLGDASVRRWKQSISEGQSRDAGSTMDTLRDW